MKVRCSLCKNQINKFCIEKKATVNLNKRRICDKYKYDETKVREKHNIPITMRSDWYWRRSELKKLIKEQNERVKSDKNSNQIIQGNTGDSKHPLTGDLSRFVSTVEKE